VKQASNSIPPVCPCHSHDHADHYAAVRKRAVARFNFPQRRSPVLRLLIGLAALPFLFDVALAAEPLSDAQMDNLTAGRRGITVPLTTSSMEIWWVVPGKSAQPFYWYGSNGWESFLIASSGGALSTGGIATVFRVPTRPNLAGRP
jgi:hypothetical protein